MPDFLAFDTASLDPFQGAPASSSLSSYIQTDANDPFAAFYSSDSDFSFNSTPQEASGFLNQLLNTATDLGGQYLNLAAQQELLAQQNDIALQQAQFAGKLRNTSASARVPDANKATGGVSGLLLAGVAVAAAMLLGG